MAFLNDNIGPWQMHLRAEYAYNLQSHHGEFLPCTVFGVTALAGRALGFNILLPSGAQIGRLPMSALCFEPHSEHIPLDHLQLWDVQSYTFSVHEYGYLSGMRCQVILKDRTTHDANYLVTVDYCDSGVSEAAGEAGWKSCHLLKLACGCLCGSPNNRACFWDPATLVKPFTQGNRPDFKTMAHEFRCEASGTKWKTEDSDAYFYDTEPG